MSFQWENPFSWSTTPTPTNSAINSGGSSDPKSPAAAAKDFLRDLDNFLTPKRDDEEEEKEERSGRGRGRGGDRGKRKAEEKLGDDQHDMHIVTERERRKRMRDMFANLHALLPQLSPKADKSTIVDEAVSYIKTLEQKLENLQKKKEEKLQSAISFAPPPPPPSKSREAFLAGYNNNNNHQSIIPSTTSSIINIPNLSPVTFQTWSSPNVVLNVCGNEAQISVCASKRPGLFSGICFMLEKYKIEVVCAHVSSDSNRVMYMIQARACCGGSDQFAEAFNNVEEEFKQVAREIVSWVNPNLNL